MGGANPIVDSTALEQTAGILIASGTAIERKQPELRALLRAYNRAVEVVNADPDAYRQIIVEGAGFPPPVSETMRIPLFSTATLPSELLVSDVAGWMMGRGLIDRMPEYDQIVLDLTD
jgi:NitT/TauT family transport system substrate-binding protein